MRGHSKLSNRQICDLYQKGYSTHQIAPFTGMSAKSVAARLHKCGVELRPKSIKSKKTLTSKVVEGHKSTKRTTKNGDMRISIAKARQYYEKDQLNLQEVAARAGVSAWTLNKRLRAAGVPIRKRGTTSSVLKLQVPKAKHKLVLQLVKEVGGQRI